MKSLIVACMALALLGGQLSLAATDITINTILSCKILFVDTCTFLNTVMTAVAGCENGSCTGTACVWPKCNDEKATAINNIFQNLPGK